MAKKQLGRRPPARLGRQEGTSDGRERILVVCEGECTEPFYLDGLRRELRLTNVEIAGRECGSDPASVVRYALERYDDDQSLDEVYCLVDRDEHGTFADALQSAVQARRNGIPIKVIVSYPAFEFWYLLHFRFTRAPIVRASGRSPGQNLERAVRHELPAYTKAHREMWLALKDRLPAGIENAKRAKREATQDAEPNPSTDVHRLVARLMGLARKT